jgi:pentapeptide MXKDX repeat protein
MNRTYAFSRYAAAALIVASSLYAGAASAEDKMKSEDYMKGEAKKADHMKGDAMKGDHMKGDHAKGDSKKEEKSAY